MSTAATWDRYDEFLDDVYFDVEIAGLTYSTSHAFRVIDPIAYREGFLEWRDENTCRADDCESDPNDGEGYDGYCGTCADLIGESEEREEREVQE